MIAGVADTVFWMAGWADVTVIAGALTCAMQCSAQARPAPFGVVPDVSCAAMA